jgi:glucokinase
MKAFAIDLGGSHAQCALVEDRLILATQAISIDPNASLASVLPAFAQTLRQLALQVETSLDDIAGIALGFCGLVNSRTGRVTSTNKKYEDAPALDLSAWAQAELGMPFFIENDARLALLGEWYAGAAAGFDDVVMVTLGTGIGGVAMIGGRLLSGKHFQAGCLGGHLPVRVGGERCTCGATGCAESEASGWALPRVCLQWPGFDTSLLAHLELNFENLFRCASQGDAVATAVRTHCLDVWSVNAVALVHAYDPELLVYGGGVMRGGQFLLPLLQKYVARHAWTPWGTVQVRAAQLGNEAALLGAVPFIASSGQEIIHVR